jgi:WD40 repeat protein
VERYPLWWTAGATAGVAGAGLLVWWAQRRYDQGLAELIPAVQRPESWVVDRPVQVNQIIAALRSKRGGTVGVTTAVQGAGGFGKTTIAKMVRADRRVLRRFQGRVYWVTVGRDADARVLAGVVHSLVSRIDPGRPVMFTDARQASEHLAALLAWGAQRRLLILDDVWTDEQLAVFPQVARCARLVTTRNPSLIAGSVPVKVDQMSPAQALAVLGAGLKPLPPALAAGFVEETGRWPLLLRLVNKILAEQARLHADIIPAAEDLLASVRTSGMLVVDERTGVAARQLDVNDPDQRHKAIRATIEASTGLLSAGDRIRLSELSVFAEDEMIPVSLAAALWRASGGLSREDAERLSARLADLALVTLTPTGDGGAIELHDVIREFLCGELGPARVTHVHGVLLDAVAESLGKAAASAGSTGQVTAWWELPQTAWYLREHLIAHMAAAGRTGQAEEVATDLRWVAARLERTGPAGPFSDLALLGTALTQRLGRVLGQSAHLLAPTDPSYSQADILCSRVSHDSYWGLQVHAFQAARANPALVNRWPLRDLPDPRLRLTLAGHIEMVDAVAIGPDSAWLTSAGEDGTVRIWDAVTGRQRAVLFDRGGRVKSVAIAPDGLWLANASRDQTVRIWDAVTGRQRAVLTGHDAWVTAVAIAADGSWLASGSMDKTVRIWDAVTGRQRAVLSGHDGWVTAIAIAPDGSWLASAGEDLTVRIWKAATGEQLAVLSGHDDAVMAVAVAPDGSWLASGSRDGTVRIWKAVTGRQRAVLPGHDGWVTAVAVAPDGSWLASAGEDGSVRIWDVATGEQRAVLPGYGDYLAALAIAPDGTWLASGSVDGTVQIWDPAPARRGVTQAERIAGTSVLAFAPDGSWLASAGGDGSVRIWDAATGEQRVVLTGHDRSVVAVAIAPDGTWLASASYDGTVRVWDAATGRQRTVLTGHHAQIEAMAAGPGGSWLASAGRDRTVRIWDAATGQQRTVLTGHDGWVTAMAIVPDGTWLASGSWDRSVRIWDLVTGRQRAVLTGHNSWVQAVAVAPDGTWLASASSDGSVRIWDLVTGRQRAVLPGHDGHPRAMAVAPDGTWLASVSGNGSLRIWDLVTGRQRAVLPGHDGDVRAVAVTPDGTWLASAGNDGAVRIWDPATGDVSALMRAARPLGQCTWSPSGESLAVAGDDYLCVFTFSS